MEQGKDIDIFIYCGEKCGSSTLLITFLKMGMKVFRAHSNNQIYPEEKINIEFESIKELIEKQNKDNIYIIDCYRNPIERLISRFFQIIDIFIEDKSARNLEFLNYYINNIFTIYEPNHPLDLEYPILKDIPFIDKYIIKKQDRFTFIKLRFSDINKWEEYLTEIFGFEIKIISDNISENKEYAELYKKFKKVFKISRTYFEKMKIDPLFIKYNSKEEQDEYLKYWEQRCEDDSYFTINENDHQFDHIPEDFDCEIHRKYNQDIQGLSDFNLKLHFDLSNYQRNRIYTEKNLPPDFDCDIYRKINKEFKKFNDTDLKSQYIKDGIKEGRMYKIDKSLLPNFFNWQEYTNINEDLKDFDEFQAIIHYINFGFNEGRIYKLDKTLLPVDFIWNEYTNINEDIKDFNEINAIRHYIDHGIREGRKYKT